MENEKNPIKENLNKLFKDLVSGEDAPMEMKKEVFQTLDTLNLLGDIVDLFTDKLTKTEVDFLDIIIEESDSEDTEEL